jgi:hypothetical protein
MFLCGCEEPIKPNSQLQAIDELSGRIELSDFGDNRLNRYSFVWNGQSAEFPSQLGKLMSGPQGLFESSVYLVTSLWLSGENAFRSKLQMRARQKSGWAITHDEDIAVAVKESSSPLNDLSSEDKIALFEGAIFVYSGAECALDQKIFSSLRSSLEVFARFGKIAPSQLMLSWLWEHKGEIGYFGRSDRDRRGIVFITPNKLALEELVKSGLVEQIRRPPEAADVWVLP